MFDKNFYVSEFVWEAKNLLKTYTTRNPGGTWNYT